MNTTNFSQGLPRLSNGDGKADLAVVYGGANHDIVRCHNTVRFPKWRTDRGPLSYIPEPFGTIGFGTNLLLAVVSRDGKTDMVLTSLNLVFVYKGNGDGTFASRAVYGVPSTLALSLADTNGNGNLDLAAVGVFSGKGHVSGSISLLTDDEKVANIQKKLIGLIRQSPDGTRLGLVGRFSNIQSRPAT